jgi:hypothetical protein
MGYSADFAASVNREADNYSRHSAPPHPTTDGGRMDACEASQMHEEESEAGMTRGTVAVSGAT